jgi:hypothetical protein
MWRIYLSVRAIALAASHAIPPKAQRLSVIDSSSRLENVCIISGFTRSSASSEWVIDELPKRPSLSFLRCTHLALVKFRAIHCSARQAS